MANAIPANSGTPTKQAPKRNTAKQVRLRPGMPGWKDIPISATRESNRNKRQAEARVEENFGGPELTPRPSALDPTGPIPVPTREIVVVAEIGPPTDLPVGPLAHMLSEADDERTYADFDDPEGTLDPADEFEQDDG